LGSSFPLLKFYTRKGTIVFFIIKEKATARNTLSSGITAKNADSLFCFQEILLSFLFTFSAFLCII